MGKVQGILYVQPSLSSPQNEDDSLPNRHDLYGLFRICGNRRTEWLRWSTRWYSNSLRSTHRKQRHRWNLRVQHLRRYCGSHNLRLGFLLRSILAGTSWESSSQTRMENLFGDHVFVDSSRCHWSYCHCSNRTSNHRWLIQFRSATLLQPQRYPSSRVPQKRILRSFHCPMLDWNGRNIR